MAIIQDSEKKKLTKDPDLKSAQHDQILSWLHLNIANLIGNDLHWSREDVNEVIESGFSEAETVLNKLKNGLADYGKRTRDYYHPCVPHNENELRWLKKQIEFYDKITQDIDFFKEMLGELPAYPQVTISNLSLQTPIFAPRSKKDHYQAHAAQNPKIIGFIDMTADIFFPELSIAGIKAGFYKDIKKWNAPVIEYEVFRATEPTNFFFDVRPSVDNVGSLLREIKILQDAIDNSGRWSSVRRYVVVAPHSENILRMLQSEEIAVIEYSPEVQFNREASNDFSEAKIRPDFDNNDKYEDLPLPTFSSSRGSDDIDVSEWGGGYNLPR